MAIKVKRLGAYVDPVGVFIRQDQTYKSVSAVSAKVAGGYVDIELPLASQVEILQAMTSVVSPYLKRTTASTIELGATVNDTHAAAWRMTLDADGMLMVRGGFTNTKMQETVGVVATNLTVAGNFVTSATNLTGNYTTVIGSYFDMPFNGVGISLNHYTDDRGGVWGCSVDGSAEVMVSTWAVSPASKQSIIATGLAPGDHTCRCTFRGADPLHPPSSGGNGRGWFHYLNVGGAATGGAIQEGSVPVMNPTSANVPVSGNSVFLSAINCYPAGSGFAGHWVPLHNGELGSIRNIVRNIYVDDVDLGSDIGVIGSLGIGINKFEVRQQYRAFSTEDVAGDLPMWDGVYTDSYDVSGVLLTDHDFTLLRDVYMVVQYLMMFPSSPANADTMISDSGTRLVPVAIAQSRPVDFPSRGALFRHASKQIAGAITADTFEMVLGLSPSEGAVTMDDRTDNISKVYWRRHVNELIPAGTRFHTRTRAFLTANAPGVAAL